MKTYETQLHCYTSSYFGAETGELTEREAGTTSPPGNRFIHFVYIMKKRYQLKNYCSILFGILSFKESKQAYQKSMISVCACVRKQLANFRET
jgi:hypothetical protein